MIPVPRVVKVGVLDGLFTVYGATHSLDTEDGFSTVFIFSQNTGLNANSGIVTNWFIVSLPNEASGGRNKILDLKLFESATEQIMWLIYRYNDGINQKLFQIRIDLVDQVVINGQGDTTWNASVQSTVQSAYEIFEDPTQHIIKDARFMWESSWDPGEFQSEDVDNPLQRAFLVGKSDQWTTTSQKGGLIFALHQDQNCLAYDSTTAYSGTVQLETCMDDKVEIPWGSCNYEHTMFSIDSLFDWDGAATKELISGSFIPFDLMTESFIAESNVCPNANSGSDCTLEVEYDPGFSNICFDFQTEKTMQFTGYPIITDDNGEDLKWNYALEFVYARHSDDWYLFDTGNPEPSNYLYEMDVLPIMSLEADNTIKMNIANDSGGNFDPADGTAIGVDFKASLQGGQQGPSFRFELYINDLCAGLSLAGSSEFDIVWGLDGYITQSLSCDTCTIMTSTTKLVCQDDSGNNSVTGLPDSSLTLCPDIDGSLNGEVNLRFDQGTSQGDTYEKMGDIEAQGFFEFKILKETYDYMIAFSKTTTEAQPVEFLQMKLMTNLCSIKLVNVSITPITEDDDCLDNSLENQEVTYIVSWGQFGIVVQYYDAAEDLQTAFAHQSLDPNYADFFQELWINSSGGANAFTFSPQIIIPSDNWDISLEGSSIQIYTEVEIEIGDRSVYISLDNPYQTVNFKKDCATENLALISDTFLTESDDASLVRKQGEDCTLTWDLTQTNLYSPASECFQGEIEWTLEKTVGPNGEEDLSSESEVSVDETTGEPTIYFANAPTETSTPALYYDITACQPDVEFAYSAEINRCLSQTILVTTDCGTCAGAEPCQLCESPDQYCVMGQCGSKTCSSNLDCPKTNHCNGSGECAECNDTSEPCQSGHSCQLDFTCLENQCDPYDFTSCHGDFYQFCVRGFCDQIPCTSTQDCAGYPAFCDAGFCLFSTDECDSNDSFTCEGFENYCEEGQCLIRDCQEQDCFKVLQPIWLLEENSFSLSRTGVFALNINDYIEDPNEDVELPLTFEVNLGQTSFFLKEENGTISLKYLEEDIYNSAQAILQSAVVEVTVSNEYGKSTSAILNFTFLASGESLEDRCRRRLKKRQLQDGQEDETGEVSEEIVLEEEDCEELEGIEGQEEELDDEVNDSDGVSSGSGNGQDNQVLTDNDFQEYFDGWKELLDRVDDQFQITKPLRMSLNISERGKIRMIFNKDMNFPQNLPQLIDQRQSRTRIAKNARRLSEGPVLQIDIQAAPDQVEKNLEFNWFSSLPADIKNELHIQLNFTTPIEVSMTDLADDLTLKILDERWFYDPENGQTLDLSQVTKVKQVPTQMPYICTTCDTIQTVAEVAETVLASTVGTSIIVGILTGMALNLVYSLINMIQLYVYLPLFDLTFPGNLKAFLKFFMKLASCDMVTNDYVFVNILMYEPSEELTLTPYNDRFEELGFDSMSMVYNLGDLALVQFYFLILILKMIVYKIFGACTDCKEKVQFTSEQLMFNWPLTFFLEAYLEICFGSWMKWLRDDLNFTTKTDSMDTVFAWFYLVISCLVPVVVVFILTICQSKIKEEGALYTRLECLFPDVSLKTWYSMNFITVFLFRRFSLVMLVFFSIGKYAVFQGIYNLYFCLIYICYIINFKPFANKKVLKQELFTEFCFLMFGYNLIMMSPYIETAETKYVVSYSGITALSINIFVNFVYVALDLIENLKGFCKMVKNKCCKQKEVKISQKKVSKSEIKSKYLSKRKEKAPQPEESKISKNKRVKKQKKPQEAQVKRQQLQDDLQNISEVTEHQELDQDSNDNPLRDIPMPWAKKRIQAAPVELTEVKFKKAISEKPLIEERKFNSNLPAKGEIPIFERIYEEPSESEQSALHQLPLTQELLIPENPTQRQPKKIEQKFTLQENQQEPDYIIYKNLYNEYKDLAQSKRAKRLRKHLKYGGSPSTFQQIIKDPKRFTPPYEILQQAGYTQTQLMMFKQVEASTEAMDEQQFQDGISDDERDMQLPTVHLKLTVKGERQKSVQEVQEYQISKEEQDRILLEERMDKFEQIMKSFSRQNN